jgi:RNA polymerase sigma-70 factor, ECF subfamily
MAQTGLPSLRSQPGFRRAARSCMVPAMDLPAGALKESGDRLRLAEALAAVAAGDKAAMRDLYARTSAKLFGICLRVLGSEAEAEEALQETYLAAWRKAAAFDAGRASPVTWLAIIARNKSIDRLRLRRPVAADALEAANDVADEAPSAADTLEQAEESHRLSHCLETLEPDQSRAIRAAFLGGATYSELAGREGVPLGTMKSWIRRGLARLKTCLER